MSTIPQRGLIALWAWSTISASGITRVQFSGGALGGAPFFLGGGECQYFKILYPAGSNEDLFFSKFWMGGGAPRGEGHRPRLGAHVPPVPIPKVTPLISVEMRTRLFGDSKWRPVTWHLRGQSAWATNLVFGLDRGHLKHGSLHVKKRWYYGFWDMFHFIWPHHNNMSLGVKHSCTLKIFLIIYLAEESILLTCSVPVM